MMPAQPIRRPVAKAREISASDGFGPLPTAASAPRSRSFTRGLCTFLLWPYRRTAGATQPRPASHSTAPALRVVNE